MSTINVVKHDGTTEPLDLSKPTASLEWATEGILGVSVSDIMIQSKLHFFEKITTSYITDIFIKTCDDMVDLRNSNYDKVARNLKLQKLYKHVFNSTEPIGLREFLDARVKAGHYSANLLNQSGIDYSALAAVIDHSKDFNFTSSGLDALIKGYGICKYETPQFIFMAIAIDIFRDYHTSRTELIIAFYEALANFNITLPSPEMRALRTNSTDYASCITFRVGDSIDSWDEGDSALLKHTVASAGKQKMPISIEI